MAEAQERLLREFSKLSAESHRLDTELKLFRNAVEVVMQLIRDS